MFARLGFLAPAGHDSNPKDEDGSLSSILHTPALRTELAVLVAVCSDSMRRDLIATFEPPLNAPSASGQSPSQSVKQEESLINVESSEQRPKLTRQPRSDLTSPQIQALRRAAVSYFDAWQVKVLRRLGEVLSIKSDAVRSARAKVAAATKAEQHKKEEEELWDFMDGHEGKLSKQHQEKAFRKLFEEQYPPISTSLCNLEATKRALILNCLLLLLLSLERYPAQSRVLLLRIASSLYLPRSTLEDCECAIAQGLLATAAKQMSADESVQKHASENAASRKWKVGLATVGGAAIIGITGGLAAPLLVAGVGGLMGAVGLGAVASLLGAVASSSVLIGGLFGAYGGRMTGKLMETYAREVEDFTFMPVLVQASNTANTPTATDGFDLQNETERARHRLRVAIGISGWLASADEITSPWKIFSSDAIEPFALRWEVNTLMRLGTSLAAVIRSYLMDGLQYEILRRTVLSTLMMGLWPLAILKIASVADNPFSVAKARADKAGEVLAEALMAKAQGERPVTLVGFSMGARVIWSCIQTLAEQNAYGLVENAIFMGAPTPANSRDWRMVRAVVAGRVVNAFSTEDWILGFLYRTSSVQLGVAGLEKIQGVNGVENCDVTELVKGHTRYKYAVGQILKKIGFGDVDLEAVEEEREIWLVQDREEARIRKSHKGTNKDNAQTALAEDVHSRNQETVLFDLENEQSSDIPPSLPPRPSLAQSEKVHTTQVTEVDFDDDSSSDHGFQPIQMVDLEPQPEPDFVDAGEG